MVYYGLNKKKCKKIKAMKQMTDQEAEVFVKDLRELLKKWNITDFSFCGTNEKKYIGYIGMNADDYSDFFKAVLNLGRLWQSGREKVKSILNEHEG